MSTMSDLFPELTSLSDREKARKIARHMPCDHCPDCKGWRPDKDPSTDDTCKCGHTTYEHMDGREDMDRRLRVAHRIDELLEEKGKLQDYDFVDDDILSLRKQILYDAGSRAPSADLFSSEVSSPSSIDGDDGAPKRHRECSEESDTKRTKANESHSDDEKEPVVKTEADDGERLLNQEAIAVNGAVDTKDGVLDDHGNLKILDDDMSTEKKESAAEVEERNGDIELRVVLNDGTRESMILLTGLKRIFQNQLPKMPREYIARLVYDRNHCSIALIRPPMKVIGGICYRPFDAQEFAEIVFCAVSSDEQVRGYGSHLMNHLKDYISAHTNVKHFLTYADNYAIGYFKKQGFTTEITLDRRKWVGYIKDYEGATILLCTIVPKVKYLQVQDTLAIQRRAVYEKMKQYSTSHIVYPGLDMPIDKDGHRKIDPLEVPGVKESGWNPEMDHLSNRPRHPPHYSQMHRLVNELKDHKDSWPFLEPVNGDEVTDYYVLITDPMDLKTLEANVENDAYPTMDEFVHDAQKIFDNCRVYNEGSTRYVKCANNLEHHFKQMRRKMEE